MSELQFGLLSIENMDNFLATFSAETRAVVEDWIQDLLNYRSRVKNGRVESSREDSMRRETDRTTLSGKPSEDCCRPRRAHSLWLQYLR